MKIFLNHEDTIVFPFSKITDKVLKVEILDRIRHKSFAKNDYFYCKNLKVHYVKVQ